VQRAQGDGQPPRLPIYAEHCAFCFDDFLLSFIIQCRLSFRPCDPHYLLSLCSCPVCTASPMNHSGPCLFLSRSWVVLEILCALGDRHHQNSPDSDYARLHWQQFPLQTCPSSSSSTSSRSVLTCSYSFPVQLPRLYNVYKEMGIIQDFQTMLDNIFIPLFEVTADPSSHPQLHVFLQLVSDLVSNIALAVRCNLQARLWLAIPLLHVSSGGWRTWGSNGALPPLARQEEAQSPFPVKKRSTLTIFHSK
jgi:hypothetical protein